MLRVSIAMQISSVLSFSILPHVRDFICHCVLKVSFENYITSIQEVFFPCLIQYFLLWNVRIFSPKQDQWFSNYVPQNLKGASWAPNIQLDFFFRVLTTSNKSNTHKFYNIGSHRYASFCYQVHWALCRSQKKAVPTNT